MIESEFEYIDKIYNVDFVDIIDKLPDEIFDLLILDFPYNLKKDFPNDNLSPNEFTKKLRYWVKLIIPKLKDTGSLYAFMGYDYFDFLKVLLKEYLILRRELVWVYKNSQNWRYKNNFVPEFDHILYFTKSDQFIFNIQYEEKSKSYIKRWEKYTDSNGYLAWEILSNNLRKKYKNKENYEAKGKINIYEKRSIGNVIKISRLTRNSNEFVGHQTQKPEALIEIFIKISSNENDLVGDFFLGSGTTCVVAKKHNRKYFGTEIVKEFYEIANNRINNTKILKEYRLKAKIQQKEYRQTILPI